MFAVVGAGEKLGLGGLRLLVVRRREKRCLRFLPFVLVSNTSRFPMQKEGAVVRGRDAAAGRWQVR